jgi:hypothetical protein
MLTSVCARERRCRQTARRPYRTARLHTKKTSLKYTLKGKVCKVVLVLDDLIILLPRIQTWQSPSPMSMAWQWHVRGDGKRRILIGQSVPLPQPNWYGIRTSSVLASGSKGYCYWSVTFLAWPCTFNVAIWGKSKFLFILLRSRRHKESCTIDNRMRGACFSRLKFRPQKEKTFRRNSVRVKTALTLINDSRSADNIKWLVNDAYKGKIYHHKPVEKGVFCCIQRKNTSFSTAYASKRNFLTGLRSVKKIVQENTTLCAIINHKVYK